MKSANLVQSLQPESNLDMIIESCPGLEHVVIPYATLTPQQYIKKISALRRLKSLSVQQKLSFEQFRLLVNQFPLLEELCGARVDTLQFGGIKNSSLRVLHVRAGEDEYMPPVGLNLVSHVLAPTRDTNTDVV